MKTQLISKHNQINKTIFNSNLIINGLKAQNENKHSSPDKIGRLHLALAPP